MPGGNLNEAAGLYSFAAGRRAKANHSGTFVWGDGQSLELASTATNQFLIRAQNGVGIGTDNPVSALDVAGTVTATAFDGDGSALTNVAAWLPAGNAGTTDGTDFLGTTDDVAMDFRVYNDRALRLEPHAESPKVIGGYSGNSVSAGAYGATIGGGGKSGYENQVTGIFGTVSGGSSNTASGDNATVGGGPYNTASGQSSTVPGGFLNTAAGGYSFAAGLQAKANHGGSFVWADSSTASNFASTGPDQFAVRATGGFRFLTNTNGSGLRLEPHNASPNIIGGYSGNTFTGGIYGATIGGGGQSGFINQVTANYGTVGGGIDNSSGDDGTVGGGISNTANGSAATVGGGASNTASGSSATVPGGYSNVAAGNYSFAAGRRAKANHDGSFVWADGTDADFADSTANQFRVRASGGARFYSNSSLTAGVTLNAGGGSWSTVSDRNLKANFRDEDGEEVLAAIAGMPIPSWNYKSQDPSIRHLGPMAQDLYAAFGLGEDEKRINTVDIDGINLLAIQALEKRTRELKAAIAELKQVKGELAALRTENSEMKTKMARFESALQRLEAVTMAGDIAEGGETTVAEVQE